MTILSKEITDSTHSNKHCYTFFHRTRTGNLSTLYGTLKTQRRKSNPEEKEQSLEA